uniref:Ribosomal RNA methyltransferase FtsJ domain-containing protein n=1 Tax=viral metagenome TaxID=1070528 RepID=A0A6C0CPG4_9ZZZZ
MTYFSLIPINMCLKEPHIKVELINNINENFLSKSLSHYLNQCKTEINNYEDEWDNMKRITNPYEYIHTPLTNLKYCISKYKPISRAFFKLIEIYKTFSLDIDHAHKNINCFHLAEGPGGFIEAMCYLRKNPKDNYYGMTLIDNNNTNVPSWKKCEKLLEKNKNIHLEYGLDKTGNLFCPENLIYCIEKYGHKMDFITGDGGFDFSQDFNSQENQASRLILTEIIYAILMQKQNGSFVLKIYDIFLKSTVEFIYLLNCLYKKVYIIKPNTSRFANSEKYIMCKGFRFSNIDFIKNKLVSIIKVLYKIDFNKYNIKSILNIPLQHIYINQIQEINAILGNQQIETITNTIKLIENKKNDKILQYKNNNISKCIQWCVKNDIPYNNYNVYTNLFKKS